MFKMNKIWDNKMVYDMFQIRKNIPLHYLFHLRGKTSKSNKFVEIKNNIVMILYD